MVAFNYRRTPAVALAKKYIEEGRIGTILNFRGTYLQDWSADPDSPLSWRFQKKIAGSGSIGDIGTHVVDLARYLVGEIAEVNALTRTYNKTRPLQQGGVDKLGAAEKSAGAERGEVDVDDEVVTMLRFADGAIGSLEATRNAYGRNNYITFEIHGTKGSIALQLRAARRTAGDVRRRSRPTRAASAPSTPARRTPMGRPLADPGARHRLLARPRSSSATTSSTPSSPASSRRRTSRTAT